VTINEKSMASFLSWFRDVFGRGWLEIRNERQDQESITARMAYESGYLAGMIEGWKWP
jgi:hypothetical protein